MRFLFIPLILISSGLIAAEPVRVAIIPDEASQPVADLLVTKLSGDKGLALVERAEMDKVMQEHQLSKQGDLAHQLDLSKLLRAQGLVILETTRQNDLPVVRMRFVAVDPGAVILDVFLPGDKGEADRTASLLAERMAPLVPKLGVERGSAILVSILNIRAEFESNSSRELQERMAMLLASRLSAEPAVLVLERRRMDLLESEKQTGDEASGAYEPGAYLIDGSIEAGAGDKSDITIHLRVRLPNHAGEKLLSASGPRDSCEKLAGDLAAQVLDVSGRKPASANWSPAEEAKQYMEEAVWAWNSGNNPLSLEATESAMALGLKNADLLFLQTWLSAEKASPESYFFGGKEIEPHPAPFHERMVAAWKAIDGCNEYVAGKFSSELKLIDAKAQTEPRDGAVREKVVHAASGILVELMKQGGEEAGSAGPLREAIRKMEGFDPCAGKFPADYMEATQFAPAWAVSGDELGAYYALQMQRADPYQQKVSNQFLTRIVQEREQLFAQFPEPRRAFGKFVDLLAADPRTRFAADLIGSGGDAAPEERAKFYGKFLDDLWERREEMMRDQVFARYAQRATAWDPQYAMPFAAQRVRLLRYYLVNSPRSDAAFIQLMWNPKTFPEGEAQEIWNEFAGLRQRCDAAHLHTVVPWEHYQELFAKQFPSLKAEFVTPPQAPEREALEVTHFWHPYGVAGVPKKAFNFFEAEWAGDKLWLLGAVSGGEESCLFAIDLKTFEAEYYQPPAGGRPYQVKVTPGAIYVSFGKYPGNGGPIESFITRYDRKAGTWATRQVPMLNADSLYLVGDNLYINLWNSIGRVQTGGIARYDWDKDKLTVLASSTRKPGVNQFDDCEGYHVEGIFEGPEGKACALINGQPYYIREDAGKWDALKLDAADPHKMFDIVSLGKKSLLYSPSGRIFYSILPEKKDPELWISPGEWASWVEAPDDYVLHMRSTPGLTSRGFYIFSRTRENDSKGELFWVQGDPRCGTMIPLRFVMDDATAGTLANAPAGTKQLQVSDIIRAHTETNRFFYRAIGTEHGVVLLNTTSGFWFIPFADVEAHLKSLKSNEVTNNETTRRAQ